MAKKLFVGNLPYSVTSDQLEEMFAPFGNIVSAIVIIDKFSGKSKGFGFVELDENETDDTKLDSIISEMNEKEIEGRKMVVNVARPREDRPRNNFRGNNRGGGGGNRRPNNRY